MLIDPDGRAITGWSGLGPVLSAATVSEPVGRQRRGYRSAEARQPQPGAATLDPAPDVRPGGAQPPPVVPPRTEGSALARAPSPEEIRRAGMFARPALASSIEEAALSTEAFVAAVTAAAERGRIKIGGRLIYEPYWRCWSSTPTVKASRRFWQ